MIGELVGRIGDAVEGNVRFTALYRSGTNNVMEEKVVTRAFDNVRTAAQLQCPIAPDATCDGEGAPWPMVRPPTPAGVWTTGTLAT